MTARRIFLSAPESRGLLAGRVSLLLRPVRFVGAECVEEREDGALWPWSPQHDEWIACPFGVPGDALWGAEAWAPNYIGHFAFADPIHYRADLPADPDEAMTANHAFGLMQWRSSTRMKREQSRHVLTLASVRVVRVRELSEEDARACGVPDWECGGRGNFVTQGEDCVQASWRARYGGRYPWESAFAWALEVAR